MRNHTSRVDFTIQLLCTLQMRHGADQYLDNLDELAPWLEEIRLEVEDSLTSHSARFASPVMYPSGSDSLTYGEWPRTTYATPIVLEEVSLTLDSGVYDYMI
jgi:hypothetical protein